VASVVPRSFKFLGAIAAVAGVLVLARSLWLPALATPLIYNDGPSKADIAVVLAGDRWGLRILKGAEMVAKGYVPQVLVSGPCGEYGHCESDYAIAFAVQHGYPREWFISVPHWAMSTRAEADAMLAELQQRGVRKFLLVTSDYHTARSARIYRSLERSLGYAAEMHVVAAGDHFFRPDSWWRDREGQKTMLLEWSKTVATLFEK
jgi:uncharacterized SAM-binding protein YcdF (DUF218 family)